ncbi:MAG TPA: 4,5-DOPA dioxygenase extradiol [Kofleriaceae bacterium]|nr:4,5-DOPA dioxygenase extradiol [Kofleriaceae bacterium]
MTASELMPVVFLGHGSPMNALDDNRYTRAWRAIGAATPRPRAILVVSAHWYIGYTAVTAMERPSTIHDFFGFPEPLFALQYSAPGAPDVAKEVVEAVKPRWAGLDRDSWGIDHGAWSVLVHLFPDADIPVLQMSINAFKEPDYHLDLAARLAPLRKRGVMIVASGNVVHNLRRLDMRKPDAASDWARRFDDAAREIMTTAPGNILSLQGHADYAMAVPTPDHYLPLLYVAALADQAGTPARVLVDGYFAGGISMTAYGLDIACPAENTGGPGAPLPAETPPEQTNL